MADKTMSILAFAENVAESHKCNLLCTNADVEIAEEKLKGEHVYRFLQGAESGYFDVIAHPDRIFRRCSVWNTDMEAVSNEIIQTAIKADIPLEMNISSVESPINYKREFWCLVPNTAKRVIGFDAHSLYEMELRYNSVTERLKKFEE